MASIMSALTAVMLLAAPAAAQSTRSTSQPTQPAAPDDLYRRRGYGTGGLVFGNTAQAGACADLRFAAPKGCGPRGGYGVYGNGLGYRF